MVQNDTGVGGTCHHEHVLSRMLLVMRVLLLLLLGMRVRVLLLMRRLMNLMSVRMMCMCLWWTGI